MTTDAAKFAERFPRAAAVVARGIERGLHCGAQIYVSQHGVVLADVGIGQAAPFAAMTPQTVLPWLSAGKPLTAVLIAQLYESGRLDWDDAVARHIPEFGCRGKERITIRHLLTHTAGLGTIESDELELWWDEVIRRICAAPAAPNWIPGETAGYDPHAGWFLLGEIVQRLSGMSYKEYLTANLLVRSGMGRTWAVLDPTEHARRADELGWTWERRRGKLVPLDWHEPRHCGRLAPGSSVRGPIRELGRFYEMLLAGGAGLVASSTVRTLTARQRIGRFDQTFGHIVDFGLGFLLDSKHYAGPEHATYGYGRFCSPETFGHGGAQSSQGYCDPVRGLVVAYVFNGRPGEGPHQRRARSFNEAIYEDLGLGSL
jgi:CubicO group peptidase (beta-lactamase class C family)